MRPAFPVLSAVVLLAHLYGFTGQQTAVAADSPIYKYQTADGRDAIVDALDKIPPALRDTAEMVDSDSRGDAIYQYTTRDGRSGYTDSLNRIPKPLRATAEEVDLSAIALNHELATDLLEAIDVRYQTLQKSSTCDELRDHADAHPLRQMWDHHGTLILIGAMLLFLVVATPFVVRHVDVATWTRLLAYVIPMLLFIGMLSYSLNQLGHLRQQLSTIASPCRPDGEPGLRDVPALAEQRIDAIRTMEQYVQNRERLLEQIMAPAP